MECDNRLNVAANLDSLGAIGQFIKDAAECAGLDKRAAYNLRLAVDEIATNIVMHGYEEASLNGNIEVSKEIREDALIITLEDSGVAFDPRTMNMPTEEDLSVPLEDRAIGGLGIYLTVNGVDRFDYERVNNHNRNIFEVKRNTIN
ncbi:MAG: ATP-binding protein [Armatimonadota bacterium]|nr:ATP-binding protein [bacterium]